MKKFILFEHISHHNWTEVGKHLGVVINSLEKDGYKVISTSFSGNGMIACIFYRKKVWKAIRDFFNISGDIA